MGRCAEDESLRTTRPEALPPGSLGRNFSHPQVFLFSHYLGTF